MRRDSDADDAYTDDLLDHTLIAAMGMVCLVGLIVALAVLILWWRP